MIRSGNVYERSLKKSKGVHGRKRRVNRGDLFKEYHFHYVSTAVVRRYSNNTPSQSQRKVIKCLSSLKYDRDRQIKSDANVYKQL